MKLRADLLLILHIFRILDRPKGLISPLFVTDVSFLKIHIYEHGYNYIIDKTRPRKLRRACIFWYTSSKVEKYHRGIAVASDGQIVIMDTLYV
jgi:hypothetical protein